MTFLKLFLIQTFKDPNLAENLAKLAENQENSSWNSFFPSLLNRTKPKGTTFKVQSIGIANPLYIDLIHQWRAQTNKGNDKKKRYKDREM